MCETKYRDESSEYSIRLHYGLKIAKHVVMRSLGLLLGTCREEGKHAKKHVDRSWQYDHYVKRTLPHRISCYL
jgi:hypothetical protein